MTKPAQDVAEIVRDLRWRAEIYSPRPSIEDFKRWADAFESLTSERDEARKQPSLCSVPPLSREVRTFDITGTTLRRVGKVLTITCEDDETANRVVDQLRTVPPLSRDREAIARIINPDAFEKSPDPDEPEFWRKAARVLALAKADAILALDPVASQGVSELADERSALVKIAAECHRSKWQFERKEDGRLKVSDARRLVNAAFDELHRIGDQAKAAYESLRSASPAADTISRLSAAIVQRESEMHAREDLGSDIAQAMVDDYRKRAEAAEARLAEAVKALSKAEYSMRKDSLCDAERLQSARTIVGAAISKLVSTLPVPAPAGWRPIETAPKDTNVLLSWRYDGVWEIKSGWAGSTKGGWLDGQATHWMPMPAPPRSPVASDRQGEQG